MARATSKAELLTAADQQWVRLWTLIDSIPGGAASVEFDFDGLTLPGAHWSRDKNMRDVMVHLQAWHRLLLDWVESNRAGIDRSFLPAPYTWKNYGLMNQQFVEDAQETTLDQAQALVRASHADLIALIESFSQEELFEKKHFSWTGTTNLASYCISAGPSHYDWAMKKIKQHLKSRHSKS
ncbi:MAG: ClbS/DfsB family four-helix bundle protein [Propionibacteriaceae bacterium]|jgi:hypothetical protein|nr:ClbS/DfsB family four-helix bundle protein [Propionibacteriaceae bacterium]